MSRYRLIDTIKNIKASSLEVFLGLTAATILISFSALGWGQNAPAGITQWSTQIQAGPVLIDMATGAMLMTVNARSKAGSPPFNFDLVSNFGNMGLVNHVIQFSGTMSSSGFGSYSASHPRLSTCGIVNTPSYSTFTPEGAKFFIWDGTGGRHYFTVEPSIRVGPSCGSLGPVAVAADDGSGYTLVVTGSNTLNGFISTALYNKDGMVPTGVSGAVRDPDGNSISYGTGASTPPPLERRLIPV